MSWEAIFENCTNCAYELHYNGSSLSDEQALLASSLSLYFCHASSLIIFGRTQFDQFIYIDEKQELTITSPNTKHKENPSLAYLFCVQGIEQLCDLGVIDTETKTNGQTKCNIADVLDFWSEIVLKANANQIVDLKEFTSVMMQHIISDLKHFTQLKPDGLTSMTR